MRKFYIWIVVLLVIGVAVCIYLFPTQEDIALIFLKGKKYTAAESYYKEQYSQGVHTSDVIIALKSIELKEGDIQGAIDLMTEYLQEHPNDSYALELLADLYRTNQQYDKYTQILERARGIKPNKQNLQALAGLYKAGDDRTKLCSVLADLASSAFADADNYLDLAYCYVESKQFEKALEVLEVRREKFSNKIALSDILFELWVMHEVSKAQGGNPELEQKGARLLKDFLVEKNNAKLTYYAFGTTAKYYSQHLSYLNRKLKYLLRHDPDLEAANIEILWDQKEQRDKIFPRLLEIYGSRPTNPRLQNLLFQAVLEHGYDYLLINLIRNTPPEMLNNQTIFDIASRAIFKKQPELAQEMQHTFGETYLKHHPLLDAMLAVAAGDKDGDEKLNHVLTAKYLSQSDLYMLLRMGAATKNTEIVEKAGSQLPPYFGMSSDQLFGIALAYIQIGREREEYEMLVKALPTVGKEKAGAALALLHAALGRSKRTAEWLKEHQKLPEYTLKDFYTVAREKEEHPLALYIAKRLQKDYPSPIADVFYAAALTRLGKIDKGIALLERVYRQYPDDPDIEYFYFSSLRFAAKYDPAYSDELVAYMEVKEEKGLATPALKLEYVYTYLDILHDYENAQELLQELADEDKLKQGDIQTLLYLWGPHVSKKHKEWIVKKAEESEQEDLDFWLDNLSYIGDHCKVIEFFRQKIGIKCLPDINPKSYFVYLGSLAYKKMWCELREAIQAFYCCVKDLNYCKKLAEYAEQVQLYEIRREIWERVVREEPCNVSAWHELAKALFEQGDYCAAVCVFMKLFDVNSATGMTDPKFYESLYEYGEILEARHCYKESKYYYFLALCDIYGNCNKTYRMLEIQALVLDKLNAEDAALCVMNQLYAITSYSPDIAASFSNLMMDMGKIKQAREFIYRGNGP